MYYVRLEQEESDPDKNGFSSSPMGRALIGSSVEDDVTVNPKVPSHTAKDILGPARWRG